MLFDRLADLPTATLRSPASEARHRVIAGHLYRWLALRWSWLRPRTVPIIVAFVGMLAILGATKYLSAYASSDLRLDGPVERTRFPTYGVAVHEPDWSSIVEPTNAAIGAAMPVEITLDRPAAHR